MTLTKLERACIDAHRKGNGTDAAIGTTVGTTGGTTGGEAEWLRFGLSVLLETVISIDPDNEKFYIQNAKSYQDKLDALDAKIKDELSSCNKDFIAFHSAFSYFAVEYGLNQHSIVNSNEPNIGPTLKTLETVINLAQTFDIDVVFTEETVDTRTSQVIANEIGARVLVLSPIETISDDSDYFLKMENNLSNLKEALCN